MAKNSKQPSQLPIEFTVPEELRECGISQIVQVGPFIKTLYKGVSIPVNFDISKLKKSADELREEAYKVITSNGIAANEIIEKLICHVISEATNRYEKNLAGSKIAVDDNGKAESEDSQDFQTLPVTTMKYTIKNWRKKPQQQQQQEHEEAEALPQLWETVRVGGKYYLVSYDQLQNKIVYTTALEDNAESKKVYPFGEDGAVEHYRFESFEELQQYIETAKLYTSSSLFTEVKEWAGKFYDTDTEEYINLIAADIVFTYFQDRIGKTHYLFVYGEPDQGKGAILETFNQLAYRGASISSVTSAAVYRMLGSVEKGQITMIIDEANRLENDDVLLTILKIGYKGSAKVPRSIDSQSSDHKMEYFYAYCFKIIAAEKLPSQWKTGGFLSRCMRIKTAPGNPEIDIGDVVDNAGDPKNAKISQELVRLRKKLFAYRLLHYSEPIPDIRILGIGGRDRELIKPLLRVFNTHGGYDKKTFDTIKRTLHYFVKERNKDKINSFEAAVLYRIKALIDSKGNNNNDTAELSFKEIWDDIKLQFSGEPIDGKNWTIRTDLFGEIGSKKLAAAMRDLGGKSDRDNSGDKRIWKFSIRTLDRFTRIYKQIPDTLEIEEQTTLDCTLISKAEGLVKEEEEEYDDTESDDNI